METNNETQPKNARTLAQIEEEIAALQKKKRSVLNKQKKQEIEALGKMAVKGGISEQDMSELIELANMLKGFNCPVKEVHRLMYGHLSKNNE